MTHFVNTSAMPSTIDVASLDLRPSAKALELRETLVDFMHTHVFPAEHAYEDYGSGFFIAQAFLGQVGFTIACALSARERALWLMVSQAQSRVAFGKPITEQGVIHAQIAESRIAIEQARLLCQYASKITDEHGNKAAAQFVSAAKVSVPRIALDVIDHAIQVHGGAGMSDDVPLAAMYGWHRAMRIFDGPDEVHVRTIAKAEPRKTTT